MIMRIAATGLVALLLPFNAAAQSGPSADAFRRMIPVLRHPR